MYSASIEDRATVLCAFKVQLNVSPVTIRKYPIWKWQSSEFEAQSELVYA